MALIGRPGLGIQQMRALDAQQRGYRQQGADHLNASSRDLAAILAQLQQQNAARQERLRQERRQDAETFRLEDRQDSRDATRTAGTDAKGAGAVLAADAADPNSPSAGASRAALSQRVGPELADAMISNARRSAKLAADKAAPKPDVLKDERARSEAYKRAVAKTKGLSGQADTAADRRLVDVAEGGELVTVDQAQQTQDEEIARLIADSPELKALPRAELNRLIAIDRAEKAERARKAGIEGVKAEATAKTAEAAATNAEIRAARLDLDKAKFDAARKEAKRKAAAARAAAKKARAGGKMEKITPGIRKELNEYDSAINQLHDLERMIDQKEISTGPLVTRAKNFALAFGIDVNNWSEFKSKKTSALQIAARLLEGGKLTDADFDRYANQIVNETYNEDALKRVLHNLAADVGRQRDGLKAQFGAAPGAGKPTPMGTAPAQAAAPSAGDVTMRSPDGKTEGEVAPADVAEAKAAGWTVVDG